MWKQGKLLRISPVKRQILHTRYASLLSYSHKTFHANKPIVPIFESSNTQIRSYYNNYGRRPNFDPERAKEIAIKIVKLPFKIAWGAIKVVSAGILALGALGGLKVLDVYTRRKLMKNFPPQYSLRFAAMDKIMQDVKMDEMFEDFNEDLFYDGVFKEFYVQDNFGNNTKFYNSEFQYTARRRGSDFVERFYVYTTAREDGKGVYTFEKLKVKDENSNVIFDINERNEEENVIDAEFRPK